MLERDSLLRPTATSSPVYRVEIAATALTAYLAMNRRPQIILWPPVHPAVEVNWPESFFNRYQGLGLLTQSEGDLIQQDLPNFRP